MKNVLACLFLKVLFALSWNESKHRIRGNWENSFINEIYNQKLKNNNNKKKTVKLKVRRKPVKQ